MEAGEILTIVKSLSRAGRSCTYHQVDLHVHSPVSHDYSGDSNISPYDFVSAFAARGFDLIAVTDHNTGTFIDKAVAARNWIATEEGKNIAVLPGVELYVSPGIHLLAILPEGGSASISDLLSLLGLPVHQHGDTTKLISKPVGDVARAVHERGGLLIGAHCNSTHGIVEELDGQARLEWLQAVDALEINSGSTEERVAKTIDYVTNNLKLSIPFTFGSDSHDAASDYGGMWVKMADPSVASLRQLIFEPELRISRTKPIALKHGRIVGFTTTHGIYADERFRFSPNLNVILGGRGAGKSAVIDLLRFAFEAEPKAADEIDEVFTRRIMGFLHSVGEVLVVAEGIDGETYLIARCGAFEKPNVRAIPVFTDPARVYQIAEGQLIQRDMLPLDVLGIEFYGQGEAARLANRVHEQLRLIDENLDHSDSWSLITEAEEQLAVGENKLIQYKQRLERLYVEVAKRSPLEERRDHLAKSLADPIFEARSRWDRERQWLERQLAWVKVVQSSLPGTISQQPNDADFVIDGSPMKVILEEVRKASDRILTKGQAALNRFHERLREASSELEGYETKWNTAFEIAEIQYRARLAELGAANLAEAAAEQRSVEQELTRIETDIEPEIELIKSQITTLESNRATLLANLRSARSAIADLRSDFVIELNGKLGGNPQVDLSGSDASLYFNAVNGPLQGSGMQRREDQISLACEAFTPDEFVDIIRVGGIDQLTAIGISENNASRMMNSLNDDVLYEIERVDVPQLPRIRMKREGETDYTDLSSLSVGEKCSAILSIALLSKGKALVIDQPEDDLDHAFIIGSIVEGIRTAKSDRQIITATHNPNIPVLGDAEMVFRVARQAGDDICRIQNSGGLELPLVTAEVQSLEGGAEAFERRRQRYSSVL